ncbi:hypothetical protein BDW67DRAFT_181467 [Aspergillus spinulosporus]
MGWGRRGLRNGKWDIQTTGNIYKKSFGTSRGRSQNQTILISPSRLGLSQSRCAPQCFPSPRPGRHGHPGYSLKRRRSYHFDRLVPSEVYDAVRPNILSHSGTAASVVSTITTTTTLAIGCLEPAPSSSCLIDPKHPQTMIQGDSTWSWKGLYTGLDWHPPVTATVDHGCTYTSQSIDANCSFSYSAYGSNGGLAFSQHFYTVISLRATWVSSAEMLVTAGLEKLGATATITATATVTKTESEESNTAEAETGVAAGGPRPFGALVMAAPVLALRVAAMLQASQ